MGKNAIQYAAPLGIERILLEYSNEENPLSITEIKEYLEYHYGISVSDDTLRNNIIPKMAEYYESFKEKDDKKIPPGLWPRMEFHISPDDALDDKVISNQPGKKWRIWAEGRLFEDHEVDYLADSIMSAPFLAESKSTDLLKRIQSLQSAHSRKDRKLHRGKIGDAKPDVEVFYRNLLKLHEAIENKRTVSFRYMRYNARGASMSEESGLNITLGEFPRTSGTEFKNKSPYRLQYMDDHYFLLADGKRKTAEKDLFRVFRVDLIEDVTCDKDGEKYIPLANEDAPADYFRGAVNGFGGRRKKIVLRCSEYAFHYVAERFLEFEGFTTTRPTGYPKNWIEVSFQAVPSGIEYWVQKFLTEIELVEPVETRKHIIEKIKNNVYGEFAELPDSYVSSNG